MRKIAIWDFFDFFLGRGRGGRQKSDDLFLGEKVLGPIVPQSVVISLELPIKGVILVPITSTGYERNCRSS